MDEKTYIMMNFEYKNTHSRIQVILRKQARRMATSPARYIPPRQLRKAVPGRFACSTKENAAPKTGGGISNRNKPLFLFVTVCNDLPVDALPEGGDGVGLFFRRGEIIKKVPQEQLVDAFMDEIAQYEGE